MALFENYEGRMPQLQPVLDKYRRCSNGFV